MVNTSHLFFPHKSHPTSVPIPQGYRRALAEVHEGDMVWTQAGWKRVHTDDYFIGARIGTQFVVRPVFA